MDAEEHIQRVFAAGGTQFSGNPLNRDTRLAASGHKPFSGGNFAEPGVSHVAESLSYAHQRWQVQLICTLQKKLSKFFARKRLCRPGRLHR